MYDCANIFDLEEGVDLFILEVCFEGNHCTYFIFDEYYMLLIHIDYHINVHALRKMKFLASIFLIAMNPVDIKDTTTVSKSCIENAFFLSRVNERCLLIYPSISDNSESNSCWCEELKLEYKNSSRRKRCL